jgi:hypothetical protein
MVADHCNQLSASVHLVLVAADAPGTCSKDTFKVALVISSLWCAALIDWFLLVVFI